MSKIITVSALLFIFITSVSALAVSTEHNLSAQVFVHASKKALPAVVNIYTTSTVQLPWGYREGGPDDLWRRFFEEFFGGGGSPFGDEPSPRQRPVPPAPKAHSLGSGFVIEKVNGAVLVLTNNHVVEGADEIKIKFTEEAEEKESSAEVIGRDAEFDVALLKVKTKRTVPILKLGDSGKLEQGEWIVALGNPFGHGHTVSHGIISARERALPGSFAHYVQVDANINPGNSGGPLVNLDGEVVGINNAIDVRGPGIGFAIPIDLVKAILPQLKEKGRVERGYIGVTVDDLRADLAKQLKVDESKKGPIVTNIVPGQPADTAGLQVYDVIVEVNGKRVHNPFELVSAITSVSVGSIIKVKTLRSGKDMIFDVTVVKRPDFKGERLRQKEKPKKSKPSRVDSGLILEQIDPEIARELNLKENFKGVVIVQLQPGSPAHLSGLRRGDVILEVDRRPIRTEEDFYRIVTSKRTYLLRIRRLDPTGQEMFLFVTLKLNQTAMDDSEE